MTNRETFAGRPLGMAFRGIVLQVKVLSKKDAVVDANATIVPDVAVGKGSVAAADVALFKCTESWGIHLGARTQNLAKRALARWPGN